MRKSKYPEPIGASRTLDGVVIGYQAIILLIFAVALFQGGVGGERGIERAFGYEHSHVGDGEIWRLVTAGYVHTFGGLFDDIGLQHIVLNSIGLWIIYVTMGKLLRTSDVLPDLFFGPISGFGLLFITGMSTSFIGGSSAAIWAILGSALVRVALTPRDQRNTGRVRMWVFFAYVLWVFSYNIALAVIYGWEAPQIVHIGSIVGGAAVSCVAILTRRFFLRSQSRL